MWPASITHRLLQRSRNKTRRAAPARRSAPLRAEEVEPRVLPSGGPAFAVGAAPGSEPYVWVYDAQGNEVTSFLAYESTFTGGTRVALADLTGDGTADIVTGAGPGGGPRVRAFDGATGGSLLDFFAYEETFTGGVFVGAGPVSATEVGIATGADAGGGPRVRVFDAAGAGLQDFFAYDQAFTGGVRVALGQAGTGPTVYATPGSGLDPTVRGFAVGTGSMVLEEEAGPVGAAGGTLVAAGDLDGDGADDLFTAVAVDGGTELRAYRGADGMFMHQSSVNVDADGLGVLNWGGQRAVGLIGDGAVRAYALVSGAESAALGQQDGPQWGGGGAALGGIVVGGLAGGLGAGAQETLTEDWVFNISPPKTVTVTSTVTKGLEGDPWTYKWEYHLVNHDFDDEIAQIGAGHVVVFTMASDKILQMGNNLGWSQGWVWPGTTRRSGGTASR